MKLLITITTILFQFMPLVGTLDARTVGQNLAEQASYSVYAIPGSEDKSVLISIPLEEEEFLQLYSPAVLRAFAGAAQRAQSGKIPEDADVTFVLMNTRHIAGEAELHLLGYIMTCLAGGERGLLADLHGSVRIVDLNVDEARLPKEFMEIVGGIILAGY